MINILIQAKQLSKIKLIKSKHKEFLGKKKFEALISWLHSVV